MQIRDILQIVAFIPSYADGRGQGLDIYFRDGAVGWQGISLYSFIRRLAAAFTINVQEARRRHALLVGQKNLIPLALAPLLVYVPVKVRTPLVSGDPAYGYFRLRSVLKVGGEPGACLLSLEGGQQISVRQSARTVRTRLRSARKLEVALLEQLCQVMEAEASFLLQPMSALLASRQENQPWHGIIAKEKEKGVPGMDLRNLMEKLVWQRLDEVLNAQSGEYCRCQRCRLDMVALALNELAPRYVVTQRGEVFSKADNLEIQRYVDVVAAVTRAVNLVKSKPRHEGKL